MTGDKANYTMVLPVRHFRIDENQVAVESAFAEHLRMLRSRIGAGAEQLVVASPGMSRAAYEAGKKGFAVIDAREERIAFYTLFADDAALSTSQKLRLFRPVMKSLSALAKKSVCVHSGLSWDVWLPFEFASIVFALLAKRRTVFVVDIDYRNSAWMSYRSGEWSRRSYLLCKYVYDVARSLQVWVAARYCSIVLLKGRKMVEDFGAGRPNVKAILDASHSEKNIIDRESVERKLQALHDPDQPLKLVYFGRLTAYKGIDRCVRATAAARAAGANVTLDIIGGGDQAEILRTLTAELHAEAFVTFHGAMQFNQDFFRVLYPFHLLLAAPLREDTPRSALDAMAAGIPYLAFDTYYYRELLESGAGRVVRWPDVDAMARMLAHLAAHREEVAQMVEAAIVFARENTQEIWLERRMEWTMASALQSDLSSTR
ncbi:glycosyltransferase [Silvibacterium sp.]|uniref:glycosyltransferase n=1 Tax=Silvibacterium sp. TaxID=1964179 RepID=UPI0039E30F41